MLKAFKVWRRHILWWTAVLLAALALKHHYSVAAAQELAWVFRPLAMLLEWITGFSFYQDSNHEWLSSAANIRLVKACAGINFMIMSFLGYAWILRPEARANTQGFWSLVGQLLLLPAAAVVAWATGLVANSLRIMLALAAADQGWEQWLPGIDGSELHRFIGLSVYVPLLSLQMALGDRLRNGYGKGAGYSALVAPLLLYPALTLVVPLLTGNALQNSGAFMEHLRYVLGLNVVLGSLLVIRRRKQNRGLSEQTG